MKKFFALAAVAAMFIACGGEKPDGGEKPGPGTEPEVPTVTSDITIDGSFADWDAVQANEAVLGTDGTYADVDLKKIKIYADALSINIYAEYDPTQAMVLAFHMDIDNDESTGRGTPWKGIELYFEGAIYEWSLNEAGDTFLEQLNGIGWDPGVYQYTGEDGDTAWSWTGLLEGGLATGSVPVTIGENLAAVEVQIMREMIPIELGEGVGVGVMLVNNTWDQCGFLPSVSMEAEEAGEHSSVLSITLPAAE